MTVEVVSAIFEGMTPCVYILASACNGTLYIGVTSDLQQRVWQHREHLVEGLTKRYGVVRLIYYEIHDTMESAIRREKQMKIWKREWKIESVERPIQTGPIYTK